MSTGDVTAVRCRVSFHRRKSDSDPTYLVVVDALDTVPAGMERQFRLSDLDQPRHAQEIDGFVAAYAEGRQDELPGPFDIELPISCFEVEARDHGPVRRRRYASVLSALDPFLASPQGDGDAG